MRTNWYIARDKKKQGPFTIAQMQEKARIGQLLPIDMVLSEGAQQWQPAAQVDDFFPRLQTAPPPPIPVAEAKEWHLSQGGKQSGPVTMTDLKGLADAGNLQPSDLVWKTGMAAWVAASNIQGLFSASKVPLPLPSAVPNMGLATKGKNPGPVEQPPTETGTAPTSGSTNPALSWAIGQFNKMMGSYKQAADETGLSSGFAAIGRGVQNMRESSRRSQLIGLWEPVSFSSQWFMFTKDNAMLRGDGLAAKFRWLDDSKIELYAEETDKTVQFAVLSLGEFELILKVGDQSGHFKKGTTITQELRQVREEEYRRRRAEAAANFKNVAFGVASVLAAGGFAVLCCGVAVGAASAGGRCRCQWPIPYGNYCANCGYML